VKKIRKLEISWGSLISGPKKKIKNKSPGLIFKSIN